MKKLAILLIAAISLTAGVTSANADVVIVHHHHHHYRHHHHHHVVIIRN